MEEKKYNREDMLYRLSNWRRVYGDRRRQGVSITEICCRYARANIKRRRETPEERGERARGASIQRAGFTASGFSRCEHPAVGLDVASGEDK